MIEAYDAEAGGSTGEAGAGSGTGSGAGAGEVGADGAAGPCGDDEADDGRADFDRFWSDAFAAISGRSKKTKPNEDPEPATTIRQAVSAMREAKVPRKLCVLVLGASPATIGRRLHPTTRPSRESRNRHDETACQRVREIVRATHGLAGAQSLGKRCGLPGRAAATIKKRSCARWSSNARRAAPGVDRGTGNHARLRCDAHALQRGEVVLGSWLADVAIPYRTSIATVAVYDAGHAITTLCIDDFDPMARLPRSG